MHLHLHGVLSPNVVHGSDDVAGSVRSNEQGRVAEPEPDLRLVERDDSDRLLARQQRHDRGIAVRTSGRRMLVCRGPKGGRAVDRLGDPKIRLEG